MSRPRLTWVLRWALRKDLNGRLAEDDNGVKISVNDIIVKAAGDFAPRLSESERRL